MFKDYSFFIYLLIVILFHFQLFVFCLLIQYFISILLVINYFCFFFNKYNTLFQFSHVIIVFSLFVYFILYSLSLFVIQLFITTLYKHPRFSIKRSEVLILSTFRNLLWNRALVQLNPSSVQFINSWYYSYCALNLTIFQYCLTIF